MPVGTDACVCRVYRKSTSKSHKDAELSQCGFYFSVWRTGAALSGVLLGKLRYSLHICPCYRRPLTHCVHRLLPCVHDGLLFFQADIGLSSVNLLKISIFLGVLHGKGYIAVSGVFFLI